MVFRQISKKVKSQEIWLACSATTSIDGRWVGPLWYWVSKMAFKSAPSSYACYETHCHDDSGWQFRRCYHYDNSKYPLSSPLCYFYVGWLSIIVCHLLILAFILALVESATTASRLLCFFFHPSTFFNTLLCLFFYISACTSRSLGRSQPSGGSGRLY